MIKLENYEVTGWEHAIRGMRNPMNSWDKSDSGICATHAPDHCAECAHVKFCNGDDADIETKIIIGPNDRELMMKLATNGSVHAKYRRMITVYVDITAPLYWWKEFDTYKVGTVANSCSTMHKIHEKEFTLEDFSCEHLTLQSKDLLQETINLLNMHRALYISKSDKQIDRHYKIMSDECYVKYKRDIWWQMIQLLPSSYNQKRTVMLNYEVLAGIYKYRREHKLDEWREFCIWIEKLPYAEIITCGLGRSKDDVIKDLNDGKLTPNQA